MTNIIEMGVHMDCAGCEAKIRKALRKVDGVQEVTVDMAMQKVTVTGWADQKKVLKAVRKTGRRAVLWPNYYYDSGDHHHYYSNSNYYNGTVGADYYVHPALSGPAPKSSYNYYVHGYDNYSQQMSGGAGRGEYYYPSVGDGARSAFSDENPHACSIM